MLQVLGGGVMLRLALQTSVERYMRDYSHPAETAANRLIAQWRSYEIDSQRFRFEYPCGIVTFFRECRWAKVPPHERRAVELKLNMLAGAHITPQPINLALLKAKMASLLGAGWQDDAIMEDCDGQENE